MPLKYIHRTNIMQLDKTMEIHDTRQYIYRRLKREFEFHMCSIRHDLKSSLIKKNGHYSLAATILYSIQCDPIGIYFNRHEFAKNDIVIGFH